MATTRAVALNQLIALRKGIQSEVHSAVTRDHHTLQKQQLLTGFTRTHRKIRDEDADLPGESQRVQVRANDVVRHVRDQLTRLWDVTAAIDWTNCEARADVVVGENVVISQAPVSYLLFLEKQLTDLHTFIAKLPTLDPAESWKWDNNADAWASAKATTVRTKKEPRNHVIAPATEQHPAQVTVYQEDVPVGYWDTIKFSGAEDGGRVKELLERVTTLREAVKVAREQANMTPAVQPKPAAAVFAYLLAR